MHELQLKPNSEPNDSNSSDMDTVITIRTPSDIRMDTNI